MVRYVFTSTAKGGWFLVGDLVFFFAMLTFSVLMVTHLGLLNPYRSRITKFFDRNSVVIRPDS